MKKVSPYRKTSVYKKVSPYKKVSVYKIFICNIILLLATIMILTGCKKKQNNLIDDINTGNIDTGNIDTGNIDTGNISTGDIHTEDIPSLQLEYIKDDRTEIVTINHGTASWSYKDHVIESDALHPLDAVGSIPEVIKIEDTLDIKLKFSSQPTSYTVRCWTLEYKQNSEAYDNFYEEVAINNDAFTVMGDEAGYIYLVHALWPQGNVYFGFNVITSEPDDVDSNLDNIVENENDTKELDNITTPVVIQDILIGGLNKGEWLYYDEFYNSGAVEFEGFEYDVYSDSRKIASTIGRQPYNWMTGDILTGKEYEYDYCIVELYENENRIKDYDIALKADWNLFPRIFSEDNTKIDYYTDIMKDHLIEFGLENPETTVKQTIKVDLEGDGIDEELIYADNEIEGTFDEVKKGDNALLIFRKYVDGKAIDQMLDYYIITEEPENPSPYRLLYNVMNVADLDGDAIMEIIVEYEYYEGFGWSIYKLKDNQLELVAANGVGA